ncbi:MAG: dockerin type I domain-containing protein [Chthoniobacterales bacterium]
MSGLAAPLVEHWDGVAWSVIPTPPVFDRVVSGLSHASAGVFEMDLRRPGGECRRGQVEGNYQIVLSFPADLSSVGSCTTSSGAVVSSAIGPEPNQYTINLAGVPNAQRTTVSLAAAQDTLGNSGNISASLEVLTGDTNGDGRVNAFDIAQTKASSGAPVTAANFRLDVNTDGNLNATDTALVKSTVGSALP